MLSQVVKTDLDILRVLADYRVLTAPQASFVLKRNPAALRRRLGELAGEGFIDHLHVPASKGRGRPSNLYSISHKAYKALQECEILDKSIAYEHVGGESLLTQIAHKLLLNYCRFQFEQIATEIPELTVTFIPSDSPFGPGNTRCGFACNKLHGTNAASEEWVLIPDAVVAVSDPAASKTLLFFLEVDTGTEPIVRSSQPGADITGKIHRYQACFRSGSYKMYEEILSTRVNGFRVLFLTNSEPRLRDLCSAINANPPSQFIWSSSRERVQAHGISGKVWVKGGKFASDLDSILGRLSRDIHLPDSVV
jgi:hypothetical protein